MRMIIPFTMCLFIIACQKKTTLTGNGIIVKKQQEATIPTDHDGFFEEGQIPQDGIHTGGVEIAPITLTILNSAQPTEPYRDSHGKIECDHDSHTNCQASYQPGTRVMVHLPDGTKGKINSRKRKYAGTWICNGIAQPVVANHGQLLIGVELTKNTACEAVFE